MDRLQNVLTLLYTKTMCYRLQLLSQFHPVNVENLSNNKIFQSEEHAIELTLRNHAVNLDFVWDCLLKGTVYFY